MKFTKNKLQICGGDATVKAIRVTTATGKSTAGWLIVVVSELTSEAVYGRSGQPCAANGFEAEMFRTASEAKEYALRNILEIARYVVTRGEL